MVKKRMVHILLECTLVEHNDNHKVFVFSVQSDRNNNVLIKPDRSRHEFGVITRYTSDQYNAMYCQKSSQKLKDETYSFVINHSLR